MAKIKSEDIERLLRLNPRMGSAALCEQLGGIHRSTLMRAMKSLGEAVLTGGDTRRTRYAMRRILRGNGTSIPLYQIDTSGNGAEIGQLSLVYPQGTLLEYHSAFAWPLDSEMADGWFQGLPYPIVDMRPQGFLGRNFAKVHAIDLEVPDSPEAWTDDHVIYVLSTRGYDQPGNLIVGETAYWRYLEYRRTASQRFLSEAQVELAYPKLADAALAQGVAGSSAGGEFPKFTASRQLNEQAVDVIVKFSGADDSAAVRRWSDLLICEQIASSIMRSHLQVDTAESSIYQFAGRTFLEVVRFDRHGMYGRSGVCTLASLNADLLGTADSWPKKAYALHQAGWLAEDAVSSITQIWWFGRLIANTDMHDGNLAFRPGLTLAPVYDMLPMLYAPMRGGEVPEKSFSPDLPFPNESEAWKRAAQAAMEFWHACSQHTLISADFRAVCAVNQHQLMQLYKASFA